MKTKVVLPIFLAVLAAGAALWVSGRDAGGAATPTEVAALPLEAATTTASTASVAEEAAKVVVYKSPTCGCCNKWVDHIREHGFEVETHDTRDMAQVKAMSGVPGKLSSCHTAIVDGYVVEGHVPADVMRRLLEERPQVVGIAVPGMPMGSPGMEGPYRERYDILAFDRDGRTRVYDSR